MTASATEVTQRRTETKQSGYLYLPALAGSVISVSLRMVAAEDFFLLLFSSAEAEAMRDCEEKICQGDSRNQRYHN